jgi:tetratricopeptide (TPR) repeat protein
VDRLREIGELSWLSTVAGILAESLYLQDRHDESEAFIAVCEETAGGDDAYSQVLARSIRAKILARRGDVDEARRLGSEAVEISEATDFLFLQAFALQSLGEALQTAGRPEEAEPVLGAALAVCVQKGYVVGANRARELLGAK